MVDELYGQLPARVYATLFQRGKLSIRLITQFSKLNARQVKNGLCVLQQHNLLFYTVDANSGEAEYSVNHESAYNLVRAGKILEMVDNSYGPAGRDVMQNLLLLGQTRVSDLVAAYQAKINLANDEDAWLDDKKPELVIKSKAQLNSVLCRLIEAELVDVIHSKTFQSAHEIEKQVHKEVMDVYFPNGIKGTKAKVELEQKVAEGLRKVREESKTLKRKLAQNGGASKRRKLAVGNETNGAPEEEEGLDPALDVSHFLWDKGRDYVADLIFSAAPTSHPHQLRKVHRRTTQPPPCSIRQRDHRRNDSIRLRSSAQAADQEHFAL